MAARTMRKLTAYKDLTHRLAIPTATHASKIQLGNSFSRFEHVNSTEVLGGATRNPRLLDIAKVSLQSIN